MKANKFIVGFLILLISSSIVYIQLLHDVKLRVDNDKTTLYVFEDSKWRVGGREYNRLFDGTHKLYRDVKNIRIHSIINNTSNTTVIIRETPFKRGAFIKDTYYFRGDVKDKKLFPIYHKVEIYNASGLFYRYEVRDLVYSGPTYKLKGETHLKFGRNVDVTLNPDYRWAWVYKSGIVKAQYDVKSDYDVFYVRLFDPESSTTTLYLDGVSADRYYEHGTTAVLKANVTNSTGDLISDATVCLDIDQVGYGYNYICDSGAVEYNLTANAVLGEFNDSTTAKNLSYTNSPENQTFYIRLNKYDEIQSAYINITGFQNPDWPLNPKIYVNDTLVSELKGFLKNSQGYINKLNDGNTTKNLTYDNAGNKLIYISIPKEVIITNATLNLTGYESGEMNYAQQYRELSHYSASTTGISYYGNYFYIGDYGPNPGVHKYLYPSLIYTNVVFGGDIYGIETNGTYIWYSDMTSTKIKKYHINGSYISEFSTSPCIAPSGITTNNTYIWVVDNSANNGTVYKFYMNGTYANDYFDTNVVDSSVDAIGITTDSNYIWVVDAFTDKINKFYMNGTYTGISYSLNYSDLMDLENDKDYFWLLTKSGMVYKHWQKHYPTNVILDIGNDGSSDYINSGELTNTTSVDLNITAIQNYLDSPNCKGVVCDVPIVVGSNTTGILQISNINISYVYNPVNINATTIQNYLDAQSSSGYYNLPVKISSETNSTIQVDNINITYYGSDNITITAHFDGNAEYSASNDTQIVKVVYSRFNYSIPVNYGYLEFIPNSPTDKNVSAYGQTETKPALNISWLNYDQPADLYMKINETHPCINITFSTNYSTLYDLIYDWSNVWVENSNLANGLSGFSYTVYPEVYYKGNSWNMIVGYENGNVYGYSWNGTHWVSNSSVVSGISAVDSYAAPCVFYKDNAWYLLEGAGNSDWQGYKWNGTQWISYANITCGLEQTDYEMAPSVFKSDNSWKLIVGSLYGFNGSYQWNGTCWVINNSIGAGLDIFTGSTHMKPEVFNVYGDWYLLYGSSSDIHIFKWNGTKWNRNTSLELSTGMNANNGPTAFKKQSTWRIIAGNSTGDFSGYDWFLSYPYILNMTFKVADTNKTLSQNTHIYLKADYNCNYTDPYWRWWLPEFLLKACTINAVKCD